MVKSRCFFGFCLILLSTSMARSQTRTMAIGQAGTDRETSSLAKERATESYGRLPLSFEANHGQVSSEVRFLSRGSGYSLILTAGEAMLSVNRGGAREETEALRMKLAGANRSPKMVGLKELPGRNNYFIGSDPKKWRTNVPTYAEVRYESIYPGIDLLYYGNQQRLEYDFVMNPGADPRVIRFGLNGNGEARIDGQGDLVLKDDGTEFRLHHPVIYQEIAGTRRSVSGRFAMRGKQQVGFDVGQYDSSQPLVIDPVLSYSTYLGGPGTDIGYGIAVDSLGNAYVTGTAVAIPTTEGAFAATVPGNFLPAFVTKLSADGSALVYSTYLGGNTSSSGGYGIAVNSSGNAYVVGTTFASDFPHTANAFQTQIGGGDAQNAFITELDATGSGLVYSTYLGGNQDDQGKGIAVDSLGNAYVTGYTSSPDFPTLNAFQPALGGGLTLNAFVAKLNPAGSALVYSTYLGGGGGYRGDLGHAIAVDASGNAYVTGEASSPNFPTVNAFQSAPGGGKCVILPCPNAFVTKFNSAGSLVYSTFLGGNADDQGYGIAVDSSGSAYVTGATQSPNFPVTSNAFQAVCQAKCIYGSAFVTKFNAAGSALVYSTYLSGNDGDKGLGIAVDSSGSAYVTGSTASANFPTLNAIKPVHSADCASEVLCPEVFVTKLNATGSAIIYSTYLGGEGVFPAGGDQGYGIAVDASGNAYITGQTSSFSFPTANAFQGSNGGGSCYGTSIIFNGYSGVCVNAFLTKLSAFAAGTPQTLPAPSVTQGGVINAASFAKGAVAPGSFISIFGSNLATGPVSASATPLFTTLLTTSATINGIPIALYYVSAGQVNAQVPFEVITGTASLVLTVNGVSSTAVTFPIAATAPGIFFYGTNRAVAVNPNGSVNASNAPAKPGDVVLVYMTGQGAVISQTFDGEAAGVNPLSKTVATTTATIGGTSAPVLFSGLAPGYVGLLQLNVQIPNVAPGDHPLVVTIGGVASNSTLITVASQ